MSSFAGTTARNHRYEAESVYEEEEAMKQSHLAADPSSEGPTEEWARREKSSLDSNTPESPSEEGTESTSSASASGDVERASPASEEIDQKMKAKPLFHDELGSPKSPARLHPEQAHYGDDSNEKQVDSLLVEEEETTSLAAAKLPAQPFCDSEPDERSSSSLEEYDGYQSAGAMAEKQDESDAENSPLFPADEESPEGADEEAPAELVQATLIRDVDESSHASDVDPFSMDDSGMMPPPTELMRDSTGFVTLQSDLAVVEAKPVDLANSKTMSRKLICAVMGALLFVIAALSVGFVVSAKNKGDDRDVADGENAGANNGTESAPNPAAQTSLSPTPALVPVLQRLQQGGTLRCGVVPNPGLFYTTTTPGTEQVEAHGFDAALCKAIAAAATGDPERVEFVSYAFPDVLPGLNAGEVDVVAAGLTHTMERQVYHTHSRAGFAFTMPYLYQGMQLAGQPSFVECGDKGLEFIAACGDIMVCVVDRSTHQQMLSSFLPGQKLVARDTGGELRDSFASGACNVIAHEGYTLAESLVREAGYEGDYLVGRTLFSKEPLAMATSGEDARFADFTNIVLNALIEAEASGITQSTAQSMDETDAFGPEYTDMLRNAVAAGGNYGELYAQFLEPYSMRQGLNMINFGNHSDTGLLYSHPFGSIANLIGQPGKTLAEIAERGSLRCGLRPNRPGFAETEFLNETEPQLPPAIGELNAIGMEADYCRAVAASAFLGGSSKVEFVEIADQEAGFALLASGEIDIVAGATWNFQNEVRVPGVEEGFAFSQPYFYGNSDNRVLEENLCMATKEGDHTWSSFVYWIVAAVVQAEESGVDQGMSNGMPNVALFGSNFELMFQDAILAIGNYHEMYQKHMGGRIRRTGRNLLNGNVGPQLYPIPGLLN
ncbi:extracellular solute-binding protein [Seminavis robusta]|uniref:Extracellular solute-binding protein n=1 Tax=Seminavis robusta TaxID=568900 RepID=A0A9N8HWM7_9STRA|nr:extracellular solute-binding protein [Seminavis robusta]|eukprot:Sro2718_g335420.1 extracellular solute-binding protein (892) ;mRNA; f:3290-6150